MLIESRRMGNKSSKTTSNSTNKTQGNRQNEQIVSIFSGIMPSVFLTVASKDSNKPVWMPWKIKVSNDPFQNLVQIER